MPQGRGSTKKRQRRKPGLQKTEARQLKKIVQGAVSSHAPTAAMRAERRKILDALRTEGDR